MSTLIIVKKYTRQIYKSYYLQYFFWDETKDFSSLIYCSKNIVIQNTVKYKRRIIMLIKVTDFIFCKINISHA